MTARPLRTRAAVVCSIADQGVAAVTNIAVLVVAARQSSAAGFAVFSVVYMVFTVLLGLSVGYVGQALVLERGPARDVRTACRAAVVFTCGASVALALSAAGVLWAATGFEGQLAAALGALALVLPVVLTHDCLRYAFATLGSPQRALAADVLRLAAAVAALAAQPRGVGAGQLIAVWGVSALPALVLGLLLLAPLAARSHTALGHCHTALGHCRRVRGRGPSPRYALGQGPGASTARERAEGRPQSPDGLDVVRSAVGERGVSDDGAPEGPDAATGIRRYWRRDHLGTRFAVEFAVGNAATQLAVIALGLWASPLAVGALRGATTLFGPMNVLFNAATGFGPPLLNRTGSPDRSARAAAAAGGLLAAGAALWATVLALLPDRYGRMLLGETWTAVSALLPATGSQYAAMAFGTCGLLTLRVLRPRTTLPLQLVFSLFAVCCLLTGYVLGGVLGAAWGICLGSVAKASASWLRVHRVLRTPDPRAPNASRTHAPRTRTARHARGELDPG